MTKKRPHDHDGLRGEHRHHRHRTAILALANGVNAVASVEEETLSSYPLQIMSTGFDLTSLMASGAGGAWAARRAGTTARSNGEVRERGGRRRESMFEGVGTNDLAALKTFLDGDESNIDAFANDVAYRYSMTPRIWPTRGRGAAGQPRHHAPPHTATAVTPAAR